MHLREKTPDQRTHHGDKDSLGCQATLLTRDQTFSAAGVDLHRKRSDEVLLGHVATPASDRGFLIGVSLGPGHRRRIIDRHRSSTHEFGPRAVYLRNFDEDYRADMIGRFDFLLLELPAAALARACEEGRAVSHLRSVAGVADDTIAHLVAALAPALDRPQEASPLFVDHLVLALGAHLAGRYGDPAAARVRARPGLPATLLGRVLELLRSRLDGGVTVAELASVCGMSCGHFSRSFRQATGRTPHEWLQGQRVRQAQELLGRTELPLAEVADACGFADQSHFTRVFVRATGTTPGRWRRGAGAR